MSHVHFEDIDVQGVIEAGPIKVSPLLRFVCAFLAIGGFTVFLLALLVGEAPRAWAAYYTNLCFWMGLAAGTVMTTAIVQIVRARWSAPVRRIAEANVAFLPYAFLLFLVTYLGKDYLFYWGTKPMPGREWWMEPNFVYARFTVLLGFLFYMMWRYVRMSLRSDERYVGHNAIDKSRWLGTPYDGLERVGDKKDPSELPLDHHIIDTQQRLSWNAPLLVFLYAIIFSLFAFEMIMGMDAVWFSNMFGGFFFIGNVYLGWCALIILCTYIASQNSTFKAACSKQQFWDLGQLALGFSVLWVYMFFSQFLPQWYGNLPEETQWLILRTREAPWKYVAWTSLTFGWIVPFVLLLSRDIKFVPRLLSIVACISMFGVWLERYVVIMPEVSPAYVPLGVVEGALFLGFLGIYGLTVFGFLSRVPMIAVSHPLSHGSTEW